MFWAVAFLAIVAISVWVSSLKRRILLEQAICFGQEFYGVNLSPIVVPQRRLVLKHMKVQKLRMPQTVFFMIVPNALFALDEWKRMELYDGLLQMRLSGNVSDLIYDRFLDEYLRGMDPETDTMSPS